MHPDRPAVVFRGVQLTYAELAERIRGLSGALVKRGLSGRHIGLLFSQGIEFVQALLAFEGCSVIGHLSHDGVVGLNPPSDSVLAAEDEVIVVAADDSEIGLPVLATPSASAVPMASV